jgi:hypothetical protein
MNKVANINMLLLNNNILIYKQINIYEKNYDFNSNNYSNWHF